MSAIAQWPQRNRLSHRVPSVENVADTFVDWRSTRRVNVERHLYGPSCTLQQGSGAVLGAANSLALEALVAALIADGAGSMVLDFDPGNFPLTTVNITHAFSHGRTLSLIGSAGGGTQLDLWGTAGTFLNFAPSTGSIARSVVRDFLIFHKERVLSGATIGISSLSSYEFRNVEILESLICMATAAPIKLKACKFNTRTDVAVMSGAGLSPTVLQITNTFAIGGIWIDDCDFQVGREAFTYLGKAIQFTNTALMDTFVITNGCHIIGGEIGIDTSLATGPISNVLIQDSYIAEFSSVGAKLEPSTGGRVQTWALENVWMSGVGASATNLLVSTSNGGTVSEISVIGCRLNDATTAAAVFGGGVERVIFNSNRVIGDQITGGGEIAVKIGDGATASGDHVVTGNLIRVGATAAASLSVGAAVTSIYSGGNTLRGRNIIFDPVPSTACVNDTNAFLV